MLYLKRRKGQEILILEKEEGETTANVLGIIVIQQVSHGTVTLGINTATGTVFRDELVDRSKLRWNKLTTRKKSLIGKFVSVLKQGEV